MVKIRYLIVTGVAVGILIWIAFHLFQNEERKIKKQFDLLAEGVAKNAQEDALGTAMKIQKIGKLFATQCEFKADVISFSGSYTPEEISGYAAHGRSFFINLHLKFYDIKITFPEEGLAKVTLTAQMKGELTTKEYINEIHELDCALRKIEKRWLFSHVEVVEVLKK